MPVLDPYFEGGEGFYSSRTPDDHWIVRICDGDVVGYWAGLMRVGSPGMYQDQIVSIGGGKPTIESPVWPSKDEAEQSLKRAYGDNYAIYGIDIVTVGEARGRTTPIDG